MIFRFGVLLLVSACFAQQHNSPNGDRQVRLEDIERENSAQKTAKPSQQPTYTTQQQQQQVNQQQLAAYQQQLLLQQLQQQYFAPQPIAYSNFGGVPLMIIPSNHLGVGTPSPLPLQAYFIPQESQYVSPQPGQFYQPQQQQQVYIQPQQRYQPQAQPSRPQSQTLQIIPQNQNNVQFTPSLQIQPQYQQFQNGNFPSGQQPQQLYYQQPQQPYNAYNAIYQQRQQKNTFAAGVKSTAAPPVKPNQQNVNQGTSFINYKSF